MKYTVIRLLQRFLLSRGFVLAKAEEALPLELLGEPVDPRMIWFLERPRSVVIDGDLSRLRSVSSGAMWNNPTVHAINESLNESDVLESLRERIRFSRSLIPETSAAEWQGLSRDEAPGLCDEPRWNSVLPWDSLSPDERRARLIKVMGKEHKLEKCEAEQLRDNAETLSKSERFIDIEISRLVNIIASLRRHGYQRSLTVGKRGIPEDVQATVLVKGDEWVWCSQSGNHRATVAAALDMKCVPIQVNRVVDRAHVAIWPNVRRGVYSKEGAIKLFDRIFSGEPSEAEADVLKKYKNWSLQRYQRR